jgi:hypothetical protein
MGTMSPEPEALEPITDRSEWVEARAVECRAARPMVEDHREGL